MMTKVKHEIGGNSIEGESENPGFILGNKLGGYFSLFKRHITKYEGAFYCKDFDIYQVLSNIMPLDADEITEHTNKLNCVERKRKSLKEIFFFPHDHNTLVYEISEEKDIAVDLDIRTAYDLRRFGRHYKIEEREGRLVITFTKETDAREDNSNQIEEFRMYVVVSGAESYQKIGEFHPVEPEYDKRRVHHPEVRHVYRAFTARSKKLFISFSKDKTEAIKENETVTKNYDKILKKQMRKDYAITKPRDDNIRTAYTCAYEALDDLTVTIGGKQGIFAGYHWFFQVWTRDEAISLRSLMLERRYDLAKSIIFRQLGKITGDGRIPSRYPYTPLQSADGVGWVMKRLSDLLEELAARGILNNYLTREDILIMKNKVETIIFSLLSHHTRDKLAINGPLETWMDTKFDNDVRDGARIEIQALRLSMYRLMKLLCRADNDDAGFRMADNLERELKDEVRKRFLKDGMLLDGIDDNIIRPNIFMACYIYPGLLSKTEWKTAFDKALSRLWNDWGGIASIDKSHDLYHGRYTGQSNESYHRGDSWFFLNCITAICMHKVGKVRYRKEIDAILDATTREILYSGAIGACSEISSSDKQDSNGCFSQAWSNAFYMELVKELF